VYILVGTPEDDVILAVTDLRGSISTVLVGGPTLSMAELVIVTELEEVVGRM